jgi:enterochelin esterase-like enzyme
VRQTALIPVDSVTEVALVDHMQHALWERLVAGGAPLIEPLDGDTSRVTFMWRGEAGTTSVEWGVKLALERLPGTDLWQGSIALPSDLRTVYYIAHDGAMDIPRGLDPGPTHVDPLNPHPFLFPGDPGDPTDHDGWACLLELPRAAPEPWLVPPADGVRGSTHEAVIDSDALGGPRRVAIHLPTNVDPRGLPVLLVFDGHLSRTVLRVPTTVDNLIAAERIPPVAVVFVSTPDDIRSQELVPHPSIVEFVASEVLPWAGRSFGVGDPSRNVIAGASLGGLVSAFVAMRRPDHFAGVISQSGSFWWPRPADGEPEQLTREYAAADRRPLRFYLDVGIREDGPGPGGAPSQVDANRRMRDALVERGYEVTYAEYVGAHDYVNWRRTFADGLLALLGNPSA